MLVVSISQLAQLGGLEVTVYPIEQGSVLVSTQKGWEGKEVCTCGDEIVCVGQVVDWKRLCTYLFYHLSFFGHLQVYTSFATTFEPSLTRWNESRPGFARKADFSFPRTPQWR